MENYVNIFSYTINDFAKENSARPIFFTAHAFTSLALNGEKYSKEPWGQFYRIYYRETSRAFDGDYFERFKTFAKKTAGLQYTYEDLSQAKSALEYDMLSNYWLGKTSIASHAVQVNYYI